MAVSNINKKVVGEAYEDLKVEGLNPSLDRIRERLGTGSKGTIQAHLKAYLAEVAQAEDQKKIELPDSIVSVLKTVLTNTADTAKEKMTEQYRSISALLDESDTLRAESESRVIELESDIEEQSAIQALALKECDKASAADNQKIIDLTTSKKELEQKLDISVQGAETSRTSLAKAEMQIERADKAAKIAEQALGSEIKSKLDCQKKLNDADKALSTQAAIAKEQAKAIAKLDDDLLMIKEHVKSQAKDIKAEAQISRQAEKEASTQTAIAKEQAKAITKLETDLVAMKSERDDAMKKTSKPSKSKTKKDE